MRDRNPRRCGDGRDRGDPGHDLVSIPAPQGKRLLAAAAEDERVAALQPDDVEPARP